MTPAKKLIIRQISDVIAEDCATLDQIEKA